jgi:hypothetical protein
MSIGIFVWKNALFIREFQPDVGEEQAQSRKKLCT